MKALRILLGLLTIGILGYLVYQGEEPLPANPTPGRGGNHPGTGPQGTQPDGPPIRRSLPPGAQAPEPGSARVVGRVRTSLEPGDGARLEWLLPRPGARVEGIAAATGTADAQGRFALTVPPDRAGALRITLAGFPATLVRRVIAPPAEQVLDLGEIRLLAGQVVQVQVMDRIEGNALGGATLTLGRPPGLQQIGWPRVQVTTDATGMARLGPVFAGTWQLTVTAPGHSGWSGPVAVDSDPVQTRQVYLARGPGLRGQVVGPDRVPLPGARVLALPLLEGEDDRRGPTACRADGEGRFHLAGLEEGRWSLNVRAEGHALRQPRLVRCPADREIQLALALLPVLTGRVQAPPFFHLEGVRVALAHPPRTGPDWLLTSAAAPTLVDEGGRFTLRTDKVPGAGPWVVVAWGGGLLPGSSAEFKLDAGSPPADLVVFPLAGATLEGRLTPAPGGRVTLVQGPLLPCPPYLAAQPRPRSVVRPDGRWRLGPIRPGPCLLLFRSPGCAPQKKVVQVGEGKTIRIPPVTLLPGVVASGVLLGPEGRPEPGGLVCLQEHESAEPIKVVAGPGGRFVLPPVRPGRYLIQACRRNAGPLVAPMDFRSSRRELVLRGTEFRIRKPLRIGGK